MSDKPQLTEATKSLDLNPKVNRQGELTTVNPLAACVRQYSGDADIRNAMEVLPKLGRKAGKFVDFLQIPGTVLKHLCAEVSNSLLESALERDLSNPLFRERILTANQLLSWRLNRHGQSIQPSAIEVQNKRPRVHLVVIPNGVGANAFVHSLRSAFGEGVAPIDVFVEPDKPVRYFHVQSIHVPIPLKKGPRAIGRYIARSVDGIFNSKFARKGKGTLFKDDDDAETSTQALMLAINLGLLIVGPVFKGDGTSPLSDDTWTMLANIAAQTGIPIVLIVTPGAMVGLIEQSAAQPVLSSRGVFMVEPFEIKSMEWQNIALTVWLKYLVDSGSAPPEWFVSALWRLTLGRAELAVKLAAFIAGAWAADGRQKLTEKALECYAGKALASEQPYLKAIIRAEQGGNFQRSAIMRYADWLDLPTVMRSIPNLDQGDGGDCKKVYTEKVRYIDGVVVPYGMSTRSGPAQYAMPKARPAEEMAK